MPTRRSLLTAATLSLLLIASTFVPAAINFCYNKYPCRRCSCFFVIHVSLSNRQSTVQPAVLQACVSCMNLAVKFASALVFFLFVC